MAKRKKKKLKTQITSLELMQSIRIPVAPPTSCHTSKKYQRKVKHKKEIEIITE